MKVNLHLLFKSRQHAIFYDRRQKCCPSPHHPDRLWTQSIYLPKANMGSVATNKLVVGGKGVNLNLPPIVPAFKTHKYFFPLPYVFQVRCLILHWKNNICQPEMVIVSTNVFLNRRGGLDTSLCLRDMPIFLNLTLKLK